MAGLKPKAMGANLLPKARCAPPENRWPVKIGAAKPPAPLDLSADQLLGKYQ